MKRFTSTASIKRHILFFLCSLLSLFLYSCSAKQSIIGIWRLKSGQFSYSTQTYDQCAIEFTENGEYLIYEGGNYSNVFYRGSYTYNGKQLNMVMDNIFNITMNCTANDSSLTIITSRGPSRFIKIDINAPVRHFDDSIIQSRYMNEGYQVLDVKLYASGEQLLAYQTKMANHYKYMDEEILRQDCYVYTPIGQYWYLSDSYDVEKYENWHINGLWTADEKRLEIHSFTSESATIDYYSPRFGAPAYQYAGDVKVYSFTDWEGYETLRINLPPNHDTLVIDKNAGVQVGLAFYATQMTYQDGK